MSTLPTPCLSDSFTWFECVLCLWVLSFSLVALSLGCQRLEMRVRNYTGLVGRGFVGFVSKTWSFRSLGKEGGDIVRR